MIDFGKSENHLDGYKFVSDQGKLKSNIGMLAGVSGVGLSLMMKDLEYYHWEQSLMYN